MLQSFGIFCKLRYSTLQIAILKTVQKNIIKFMLASDEEKVEDYDWINKYRLKKSGWASLYRVLHLKTGIYVAIKEYKTCDYSEDIKYQIMNIISAAQIVKGDCIVKHLKTFIFPEFLYVVMELCDFSLQQYLEKKKQTLKQEEIGELLSHVVKGMKFIREKNCVHGNLNPFNILKKGKVWKLAHFCKPSNNGKSRGVYFEDTRQGKFRYVAPEILLLNDIPSLKSDVWSFGILIHQLIYGSIPYDNLDICSFKKQLLDSNSFLTYCGKNNQKLQNLMHKCLIKNPSQRISWEQIQNDQFLVPYMQKQIMIEESQKKDIVDILTSLQTSASLFMGSEQAVQKFCNGQLQWNGIKIQSNKLMKYEQFRKLCQNLSPTMDQIEIRMVYKWMDTSDDGYIDQKQFARILSSLRCIDVVKKFLDELSNVIKDRNIDAHSLFSKCDIDQSASLQQNQLRQIANNLIPTFPKCHLELVIDHVRKKFDGKLPIKTIYDQYKSRNPEQSNEAKNSRVQQQLQSFKQHLKEFEMSIAQIVKNFDRDKNDKLDFEQFKKLVYSVDGFVREEQLKLMFNEVDKNKSGNVSVKELQSFLQ